MAGVQEQGNPSVVLVHGAFVDGSGWEGVYTILKQEGGSGPNTTDIGYHGGVVPERRSTP
jgi:hypothetical protein